METNVIQRKDTRVAAINEWLAAKAQSLSKWYNGRSKSFSPLAGNVFSKKSSFPLPVHKLSLPLLSVTITNYRAASGIGHCSAFWLGHFLCPYYIRIGGCHSVIITAPCGEVVIVTSGMCSRFSVSPRPAVLGMVTITQYGN